MDEPASEEPAVPSEPSRESVVHVPVPDKVAEGAGGFKADWSFDLVAGQAWSAHVHVIPQGQLVPAHQHPENDELVFVASGSGEWVSHHWEEAGLVRSEPGVHGAGVRSPSWRLAAGDAVVSPSGAVHSVRNREEAPLATVVLQRPEFGQNWYVVPGEVRSERRSRAFLPPGRSVDLLSLAEAGAQRPADPVFEGWTVDWHEVGTEPSDVPAGEAELLYMVSRGGGSLAFEEHSLPLQPGAFVKMPPGLQHRLVPAADGLELLRVRIPRTEEAPSAVP